MTDRELVRRLQEAVVVEAELKNVRELLKQDHTWRKAKFRDSAIYIARVKTSLSMQEIGELFGARHHTTIVCAVRRETERLKRKPPRHDKRTWPQWHEYLYEQAMAAGAAAELAAAPLSEPETPAPAMSEAEKGFDNA